MKKLLTVFCFILISSFIMGQGVTTSKLNGSVSDTEGEVLIGANVTAVHQPSGTFYGNATNLEGIYRIQNMRVGGPYTITVSYSGYEDFVREGVYLSLGQSFNLDVALGETSIDLSAITISASSNDIFDGNRTGQQTILDEKLINDVPTISRAIGDFARLNPLANITEDDDGFEISLAGQNNRYNSIYIDGAVSNDVFGLAGSGTNGGQTGVNPISIDAIEQFQISVAPFDVRQSGFAGGAINAVTRSGTNNLEGSAYIFHRNESLAGKTPTDILEDDERTKLDDFSATTYGLRLGGPIIKNKLFLFVNAEIQRDDTPQPFDITTYNGDASADDLNGLSNFINSTYNYDVGTYDNNTAFLESDKFLAKIDYNINNDHKLSLRHSYVRANNLEARNSGVNSINFITGSESFISKTHSTALELNSVFGNSMSNNLTVSASFVRDDRDPSGSPFPTVFIEDGDAAINLGAERFSTANLLNQDVITIKNDFNIYKGKHNLLIGANVELFNAGNLFIRNNYGRYRWFNDDDNDLTGLDQFLAGAPATRYERSFSQVDNVAGDETAAIAAFKQSLIGFYVQDEIQLTNKFKITAGIRVDVPIWPTDQPVNDEFNNSTIPAIESFGYDLKGARTGNFIGSSLMFSPRVGFNYDVNGDRTLQLRGGVGIFTSRIPLVWPGGAYNNYGFNIGEGGSNDQEFIADVQNQPVRADLNNLTPSGQIDLFAEDFKLPQVLKLNLAADKNLGNGFIATLEGIYSKELNAVRYENLNLKPNDRNISEAGGDTRPLFLGTQAAFGDDVIDPNYTYIMLGSNTSEGYSYNLAASVSKNFANGFSGMVSYSYGDSYSLFDATSSQNNSQWRGFHNVNGRNTEQSAQRSTFAAGHRFFGQIAYEIEYANFGKSKISLNFNAQSGNNFSYVVGARNFRYIDDGGFDNNELVYVPSSLADIPLTTLSTGGVDYTPEEQWTILDAYIEDSGLSKFRGGYSERNIDRSPMQFTMDMRFTQDIFQNLGGKKNTLQLSIDVFNFTNMINKDWGRIRFAGSFGNYRLIELENSTTGSGTTPEYTISTDLIDGDDPWTNNIDDAGFRSSRWQMQVGLRYIFE